MIEVDLIFLASWKVSEIYSAGMRISTIVKHPEGLTVVVHNDLHCLYNIYLNESGCVGVYCGKLFPSTVSLVGVIKDIEAEHITSAKEKWSSSFHENWKTSNLNVDKQSDTTLMDLASSWMSKIV